MKNINSVGYFPPQYSLTFGKSLDPDYYFPQYLKASFQPFFPFLTHCAHFMAAEAVSFLKGLFATML